MSSPRVNVFTCILFRDGFRELYHIMNLHGTFEGIAIPSNQPSNQCFPGTTVAKKSLIPLTVMDRRSLLAAFRTVWSDRDDLAQKSLHSSILYEDTYLAVVHY